MNDKQDNTLSVDEFIKIVNWVRSWETGDLTKTEAQKLIENATPTLDHLKDIKGQ